MQSQRFFKAWMGGIFCVAALFLSGCDEGYTDASYSGSVSYSSDPYHPPAVHGDFYSGEVRFFVVSSWDGRPLPNVRLDVELINRDAIITRGHGYSDVIGFEQFSVSQIQHATEPYSHVRVHASAPGFQTSAEVRSIRWVLIGPNPRGGVEWRFDTEIYIHLAPY
jgi:hypothetical protein